MPKRTNEFQQLVHLIEHQLAAKGAKVTQSKMLKHGITGEEREVDIVIEYQAGIHLSVIGIECTSTGRKATSNWVEGIIGKHRYLPIHQTILVSKSGFSRPAEKLANEQMIQAISFTEALEANWLNSFNFDNFLLPYISAITVIFADGSTLPDLKQLQTAQLFRPDGTSAGTIYEVANRRVNDPAFIKAAKEYAFEDGGTIIDFTLPLIDGTFLLDQNREKQMARALDIETKCRKEFVTIVPTHAIYDTIQVALGSGAIFGKKIQFAVVKQSDDEMTLGISLKNLNNPRK